jgi:hypothetical protein
MAPQTRMKIPCVDSSLNQVDRCPADHQKTGQDSCHLSCVRRSNVHKTRALLLVGIAALMLVQGCECRKKPVPEPPGGSTPGVSFLPNDKSCGTFDHLASNALPDHLGAEYKVQFKFQPADCNKPCNCEQIAYVQIARVVLRDGTYWDDGDRTPLIITNIRNGSGEDNTELNGWFIDAWLDAKYGYYARNSNGTFNEELIRIGQNKRSPELPAWLFDRPLGLPKDSLVEFVDAPVCLDTHASCNDRLLGYSHWWFTIGKNGSSPSVEGPVFDLDPKDKRLDNLKEAVRLAAARWNDNASKNPGIEPFPSGMVALK